MQQIFKKVILTFLFISLFAMMLIYPEVSLGYAADGLTLWFNRMVPTLFPFMILSTLLVRQNLTETFAGVLYPVLGKVYGVGKNAVYCMILGFLCGFPMGARTIGELYDQRKLNRKEATLLLAFCNNIGPVYFISFFLPVTGLTAPYLLPFLLIGMYGIPLLYGIILRYTGFLLPKDVDGKTEGLHQTHRFLQAETEPFQDSLDIAINSAITGITTLGGYMILCNLLNLFGYGITQTFHLIKNPFLEPFINCLLEITSGLSRMGSSHPICSLLLLPIGGLSCLLQTKSMIKHTDLSLGTYFLHKCCQTILSACYYFLLRFLL